MILIDILLRYLTVSAITGVLILLLCMAKPCLNKIYAAKARCIIWLMLALYLVFPLELTLRQLPIGKTRIEITVSDTVTVYRNKTEGQSEVIWKNSLEGEKQKQMPSETPEALSVPGVPKMQESPESDEAGTNGNLSIWEFLFLIWGAGCILSIGYEWLKYRMYQKRLKRWSSPCQNALTMSMVEEISEKIKMKPPIPVFVCAKTGSPMMTGLLHPCIFLPHEDFTEQELSMIIRHELTHYKRRDLWRKVLFLAARALHWFNPLVYLMCRQADADMEQACDDCLLEGESMERRKAYSEMILGTIKYQREHMLSTYFYGGKSVMKDRFENILYGKNKKPGRWICFAVCLCMIVANSLVGCGAAVEPLDHITGKVGAAPDNLTMIQADKMILSEAGYQGEPCYEFVSPQGTTVILYCDPVTGHDAYAVINGQQYSFAEESGFYVTAIEDMEPSILVFDGNQDGKEDIFIWAKVIKFGMEQNAYLAANTGYQELGGVTWRMDGAEHAFAYEAAYCDGYGVHVTVPEYGIDAKVPLTDEYFRSVAEALGIFDKKGRITKEAEQWSSREDYYTAPFETNIECGMDGEGSFILRAYAPLYAGYSEFTTGAVFVQDFKLTDAGWQLNNVYLMQD